MTRLSAMPYYGGKSTSGAANAGVGRWVSERIPTDCVTYAETHAGMLGVLLSRSPAPNEIVNDLNGRIVNWWIVVRDHGEELSRLFYDTPVSDDLFAEYAAGMDVGDDLERALKFTYVICYGQLHGDGRPGTRPPLNTTSSNHSTRTRAVSAAIPRLQERVRHVHVSNRPAVDLLGKLCQSDDAVVYVDPPYRSAHTRAYSVVEQDIAQTLDVLRCTRARVAVSGYGDEWDELLDHGWVRSEYRSHSVIAAGVHGAASPRVEVLWTSYDPVVQGCML